MTTIADNLQTVRARIEHACRIAGRDPGGVRLLAVSKTFGADAVQAAYAAGQRAFGENYIQEAAQKIQSLALQGLGELQWHCIGPIQSNKTRLVAEHFGWVHSIDRLKIAERLSEQRPSHLLPLQVCIQVNIDGGPTKAGVAAGDALKLAYAVRALPGLQLRGLMTIPEPAPDFDSACAIHSRAAALYHTLNAHGLGLDTLSMGMTADLEAAVHCGSTMVRVGSAIFGSRTRS